MDRIAELEAQLDAERAEIAKVRATCDMLGKERNEADEAKYHAELKLTQLQALVRAIYAAPNMNRVYCLIDDYRASLDALTPAATKT